MQLGTSDLLVCLVQQVLDSRRVTVCFVMDNCSKLLQITLIDALLRTINGHISFDRFVFNMERLIDNYIISIVDWGSDQLWIARFPVRQTIQL